MSCILCFKTLSKTDNCRDFNLVVGPKSKFNVANALQELDVVVEFRPESRYICRECLRLLQKLDSARKKVNVLADQAAKHYIDGANRCGFPVKSRMTKRALFSNSKIQKPSLTAVATLQAESPDGTIAGPVSVNQDICTSPSITVTSTPVGAKRPALEGLAQHFESKSLLPVVVASTTDCKILPPGKEDVTTVSVKVCWKSKTREKNLPKDLISVGAMLCRGTYKQLAYAVWKHPSLRAHIIEAFCKEVDKECVQYCLPTKEKPGDSIRSAKILRNSPSKLKRADGIYTARNCLRLTGKDDMLGFTFDKLDKELKQQMPLSRSVLMTMCWRSSKRKEDDLFLTPAVGMAAAVCLKNRSKRMTAVQLIISTMMQHSGFMATLLRLSALRLAVSHTFLYNKLNEYGRDHLRDIVEKISNEGEMVKNPISSSYSGRKLIIDNFNFSSEPHQMTAENQKKVVNWVGLMITENRILGDGLHSQKPSIKNLAKLENGLCIPSSMEHNQQRLNYIALCGRLAVENIKCLKQLEKVAFDHLYSPKSSSDKCTMFADKVFINRRNVRSDVSQKVEGCKQFFILEVTARVLAAYCEILGIKDVDDEPDQNTVLDNVSMMSIKEKKELLDSLSAKVVDNFIIRKERNAGIVNRQIYEDWLLATNVKDDDGMYLCRKHGCLQTFKFDGKRRIEHEKMHGLHKKAPNTSAIVIPGRKYSSYAGVKPSLLEDFDIHAMYKWIQDHKSLAKLNKAGR
eukprot:gene10125-18788_t